MVTRKEKIRKFLTFETMPRLEILIAAVLIFTIVVFPSLMGEKDTIYQLGEIATQNVKAPRDFLVEDQSVTEARRAAAEEAVLPVYDYDPISGETTILKVRKAFMESRILLDQAKVGDLMRQTPGAAVPMAITPQNGSGQSSVDTMTHADPNQPATVPVNSLSPEDIRRNFDRVVDMVIIGDDILKVLEADNFSEKTENAICDMLSQITKRGIVSNKDVFMREASRGITLRNINTQNEQLVVNFDDFTDVAAAKVAAENDLRQRMTGSKKALIDASVKLVDYLIQPNVTLNRNETLHRKTLARENVKPVLYQIKAGEMILREGEPITEVQLVKLKVMGAQATPLGRFLQSLGMTALIFMLLIASYYIFFRKRLRKDANINRQVLFMSVIFVAFFIFTQLAFFVSQLMTQTGHEVTARYFFYGLPLAAAPMIVCMFLNWRAAAPFSIISATCFALVFDNSMDVFVYFFITGVISSYLIIGKQDRKAFATISFKLALLNILVVIILALYNDQFTFNVILTSVILAVVNAILTPIVTMGVAPLIELAFGYNTNMTLLELANLDRPLLKRLILEAPGTYHHSILVGSLAESAASEVNANPLVAKVGGYYHDIGKLNKPTYFIENISRSQNKHDKLAPSMSSLILQAHVKDGAEMAREYKLGKAIEDIIRQHHGTSLIRFFYEKAKSQRTDDQPEVEQEDYRYPGPKPQSKEAALVMLADVIEASSRALQNPTSARLKGLVQKMINEIFADGQLSDCDLTLRDLHKIANTFHKMLCGIHHSRIEYPESGNGNKEKGNGNGNNDRKPSSEAPPDRNAYAGGGGQLKGLGDI